MDAINGVCSLFSGTCPEVTLMSRRTLGRRIDDAFQQKLGDIKRKVLQATSVCTTTDVWSTSTKRFMGVTAHWVKSYTNFYRLFGARNGARAFLRIAIVHKMYDGQVVSG